MKYYLDCEFDGHNGPLLSMALVAENGDSIHIQTEVAPVDPWVIANVMPVMGKHHARWHVTDMPVDWVGREMRMFLRDEKAPIIIADSPVDIGRFCQAISTGSGGQWMSVGFPQMTFEVRNVDCYPTDLPGAVQHNAWWDAKALQAKLSNGSSK